MVLAAEKPILEFSELVEDLESDEPQMESSLHYTQLASQYHGSPSSLVGAPVEE
ncbi:hypothetical protein CCP3SC15_740009 [Gammaproteobacteria bacterium]